MKGRLIGVVLTLALSVTFIGCGGGGGGSSSGGSDSGTVVYSSDYYGMEVGFQRIYSCSEYEYEDDSTETGKIVLNVMSVTEESDAYIYKVAIAYDDETLGSWGEYVKKSGANYYDYGEWEGETDYLENTPTLLMTDPVADFTCKEWGTNMGQVSVTVNAGTFTAWLFEKIDDTEDEEIDYFKLWFVPYLGIVKASGIYVGKSDGETIYSYITELNSTAKGVTITSSTTKSSVSTQAKTQSTVRHRNVFFGKRSD
jgi:hypothetical protein